MLNRTAWWQYGFLLMLAVFSVIYALPSLYGERQAVEVALSESTRVLPDVALRDVQSQLKSAHIAFQGATLAGRSIFVTFNNHVQQLKAHDVLQAKWHDQAHVALALRPRAPAWFARMGAHPIKLGLDLRGGVHFLLDVDVDAVVNAKVRGDLQELKLQLRDKHVRYDRIVLQAGHAMVLHLKREGEVDQVQALLSTHFRDYDAAPERQPRVVRLVLKRAAYQALVEQVIGQNITTLVHRVNELGVSEAVVQQQGMRHISVDLPGIQDVARAKALIGKTATLRFQLVDSQHELAEALAGDIPVGSRLYYDENKQPILLNERVILAGRSITNASVGADEYGRPDVQIALGGGGESLFYQTTANNIGERLAVIYVEMRPEKRMAKGKLVTVYQKHEVVLSAPVIHAALGNQFIITSGGFTQASAQQLALLLRSGAFAAPVSIVEERTVGPSLGAENIHKGMMSLVVGSLLVVVFMALYYRVFGLIANVALLLNVVLIIAVLSVLGATLTLAGMAGIVLTVGMAVDANVLIYERIREELRLGQAVQSAIKLGYDRAFITIVDSNVTTLIVALILFALGSASVKGFAVTLIVGLLASMITAIVLTRAIVNAVYGSRSCKRISIGI